ncbi:MAG TPA: DNA-binding protein [Anaerolineae bacterium]|nr:DNA-binding protein [Anaerolineae bacterium]
MDNQKLLTVDQVAEILQVSRTTVYRRIRAGVLPAVKLGHRQVRIRQEDLEAYIEAHRIGKEPAEETEEVKE